MIVAIEGTSAAGKTTWCDAHAGSLCVPEGERDGRARWRRALDIEAACGLAICDTDPAKLYYAYALWQTGRLDDAGWRAERDATREAFASGALGLPDLVFFAERDVETLERHRAADATRRRHRFALHVELQPRFKAWWDAVDAVEPGRVFARLPDGLAELRAYDPRARRTGADLLDAVLANLP